jgi:hypothetical protein
LLRQLPPIGLENLMSGLATGTRMLGDFLVAI